MKEYGLCLVEDGKVKDEVAFPFAEGTTDIPEKISRACEAIAEHAGIIN